MSAMYVKIKKYYDYKIWTIEQVKSAVKHGKITEEEYAKITGIEYNSSGV